VGRFKADTYWYVPLVLALGLITAGAIQLATHPAIPAFADGWFERDEDRMFGWELLAGGGFALVVAIHLWVTKVKRLRLPDDVRKLRKLDRKFRAGELSEADYQEKRNQLLAASQPEP
jgi:hypothetical protein